MIGLLFTGGIAIAALFAVSHASSDAADQGQIVQSAADSTSGSDSATDATSPADSSSNADSTSSTDSTSDTTSATDSKSPTDTTSAPDSASAPDTTSATDTTAPTDTTSAPARPVIAAVLPPATGNAGWYLGPVDVSWTITPDTDVASTAGCDPSTVTAEGSTDLVCTATLTGGGTVAETATIEIDATPPVITCPEPPALILDSNPVALVATVADATSGVLVTQLSGVPVVTALGDYSVTFAATDNAGNHASQDCGYSVVPDPTPPVISYPPTITGTLGANGWYIGDVTVHFDVTDPDSPITSAQGCDVTITTDGSFPLSCTATSGGGTSVAPDADQDQITVQRDTTPPAVTCPVFPTLYQGSAPISLAATASDDGIATSGVATAPTAQTPDVSTVGTFSLTYSATDGAGNVGTAQCPYDVVPDTTPPVITQTITGTLSASGWYAGDVAVSFAVVDPESIPTSSGCDTQTITEDVATVTYTCTATSDGGVSTDTATIQRDATPPVITCPQLGSIVLGNPVTLTAAVADATSGPIAATVSATLDTTVVGPGSVTLSASDVAGNSASQPCGYTVVPDPTAPVVTATVDGPTNDGAAAVTTAVSGPSPTQWYVGDVTVSFSVEDPDSPMIGSSDCGPTTITTDTTGITLTCTATSYGGTTTQSITVARDATPPTISCPATPPTFVQGTAGSFAAQFGDATSGVASPSESLNADTASVGPESAAVSVADEAGNVTTSDCPYRVLPDLTPPTIIPTVSGPLGHDGWYVGNVTVTFAVADPDSPLLSMSGCAPVSITQDTSGTPVMCEAASSGGDTKVTVVIKRDTTKPALTCLNVDFIVGASATQALGSATDSTSGVDSPSVTTKADTSTAGTRTASLSVTDDAGNTATAACPYQVFAPTQVKAAQLSKTGQNYTPLIVAGILVAIVGLGVALMARAGRRRGARHSTGA